MPNIISIYTYSWVHPIQVIVLKKGVDPRNYIETFDYTFCQNYYDGENINSYHPQCVKAKRGFLNYRVENPELQFHRTLKYEARGYTIVNRALGPSQDTADAIAYEECIRDYTIHKYPAYMDLYKDVTVGNCGFEYLKTLQETNERLKETRLRHLS
jgi:hypothetical protein